MKTLNNPLILSSITCNFLSFYLSVFKYVKKIIFETEDFKNEMIHHGAVHQVLQNQIGWLTKSDKELIALIFVAVRTCSSEILEINPF